jgi:hypothetical protein
MDTKLLDNEFSFFRCKRHTRRLGIDWQSPAFNCEKVLRAGREPEDEE